MKHVPDPDDEYDAVDVAKLNAEPWMLQLLSANPSYVGWGPFEDYMTSKGGQWNASLSFTSWQDFGPLQLDDYNEVVHWYFEIVRESKNCNRCGGSGYHLEAQGIVDSFHVSEPYIPLARIDELSWKNKITQDELYALIEQRMVPVSTTLEAVNNANYFTSSRDIRLVHDGLSKAVLIRTRLNRLGIPLDCPKCSGTGSLYIEPGAKVRLILWVLHPRKGASRGIEIKNITRENLHDIRAFLLAATTRNAERFEGALNI